MLMNGLFEIEGHYAAGYPNQLPRCRPPEETCPKCTDAGGCFFFFSPQACSCGTDILRAS